MQTKTVAAVANAELIVDRHLPPQFAVAHFRPGATLPAAVRFSNASRIPQADHAPDLRGIALRLTLPSGGFHDLLLATAPTSIARNARQFLDLAALFDGDRGSLPARLAARFGAAESMRIVQALRSAFRLCPGLALEHYWSGTAFLWGDAPVRFELRPSLAAEAGARLAVAGPDSLGLELLARLGQGPVRFRLAIQRFLDEKRTPIEDSAVSWRQERSGAIEIATLLLPAQAIGAAAASPVDEMQFNPWNAPPEFRPLGSLNRLRGVAYARGRCAAASPTV